MVSVDRERFFGSYRDTFGSLDASQLAGVERLLAFMERDDAMGQLEWCAYVLATVRHECANTWQPITERGPVVYFNKYEPGTPLGRTLGNRDQGDGYLYRGRGFVQLTGRTNYARASRELGLDGGTLDLVVFPERALDPRISYEILSRGMRAGWFTGRKLDDYIRPGEVDYVRARRIVNGDDRAEKIAHYARGIEACLRAAEVTTRVIPREPMTPEDNADGLFDEVRP
jgi:hypothetical protein